MTGDINSITCWRKRSERLKSGSECSILGSIRAVFPCWECLSWGTLFYKSWQKVAGKGKKNDVQY